MNRYRITTVSLYPVITTLAVVDPWQVLLSTDASGARGSDRKTLELRASGEVSYKGRVFKSGKTRILFAFNHLDSFCIDMTGGFSLRSTFHPKLGL